MFIKIKITIIKQKKAHKKYQVSLIIQLNYWNSYRDQTTLNNIKLLFYEKKPF